MVRCISSSCWDMARHPDNEQDAADLEEEVCWAASRPGSRWTGGKPQIGCGEGEKAINSAVFEDCLTPWEMKIYLDYQAMCPNSIYSLNQSPDYRPICAKTNVSGLH